MKRIAQPSKLVTYFLLVIIFPVMFICIIAIRSLDKDAAFIEKEARIVLEGELDQLHFSINKILKEMHVEIGSTLSLMKDAALTPGSPWAPGRSSLYIKIPFILSKSREFIVPDGHEASAQEREFMALNKPFFQDGKSVPDYSSYLRVSKGASSITFSKILEKGNSGIIPRIIDNELQLIFWEKKGEGGLVVGCLINKEKLIAEIIESLPELYTDMRILTILNESGRPLMRMREPAPKDWRKTFVSRKISRVLPQWEIAMYLPDANYMLERERRASVIARAIIFSLILFLTLGGVLVIHLFTQEMKAAQQKADFATNVSHELKTPLTSIRMFSEMLLRKKDTPPEKKEQYYRLILSEAERLTRLINNVLDFSALEKNRTRYQMQDFDLGELCAEVIDSQKMRYELKGFTVDFCAGDQPVKVHADPESVKQVLLNVLSNAEKYSLEEKAIKVNVYPDGGLAVIDVSDKGIGVAPEEAQNIFKGFYRVDDQLSAKTRGTGLGLTITKKILRDHGGDVLCIPQKKGSLFRIQLPIKKG